MSNQSPRFYHPLNEYQIVLVLLLPVATVQVKKIAQEPSILEQSSIK